MQTLILRLFSVIRQCHYCHCNDATREERLTQPVTPFRWHSPEWYWRTTKVKEQTNAVVLRTSTDTCLSIIKNTTTGKSLTWAGKELSYVTWLNVSLGLAHNYLSIPLLPWEKHWLPHTYSGGEQGLVPTSAASILDAPTPATHHFYLISYGYSTTKQQMMSVSLYHQL